MNSVFPKIDFDYVLVKMSRSHSIIRFQRLLLNFKLNYSYDFSFELGVNKKKKASVINNLLFEGRIIDELRIETNNCFGTKNYKILLKKLS